MSESQLLLSKIAALRQRLEQAKGLADDAGSLLEKETNPDRLRQLERQVASGARQSALLDTTLRQLPGVVPPGEATVLPTQLTARASRLLKHGRDLLVQLRTFAEEPLLLQTGRDPLGVLYTETAAMTDTVLRTVQAFPEAPSVQLRLCEGLEAILRVVAQRLALLRDAIQQRRLETARLETLAQLLTALAEGQATDIQPFVNLAQAILADTHQALPLRWHVADPHQVALFVAAHSLNVAQVAARLSRHDPDWRTRPLEPILAALLHDVGMLRVPVTILGHAGPLDDEQRRVVEAHVAFGADRVARLLPMDSWLTEAVAGHHERLDGTGYPAGLRELQIAPLARLLAVCDVYAALCSPRPHRPALETRTALTDTLVLAEQSILDRFAAERLLQLTFYPVGSAVELADGAVGIVIATHQGRRDLNTPARPVVALLTDTQGQALPFPRYVDLAECEGRSILRNLSSAERCEILGQRYPELS
jgi:HD-GYP domain-containing protein (c-di-GMP phosphodiesterase class II)